MIVTSSWRTGGGEHRTSAHQEDEFGVYHAVDISCIGSRERHEMLRAVYVVGFPRVGIYDKHLHLDVAGEPFDHDVTWWGKSK